RPVEQVRPAGNGERPVAHRQRTPRRVVGGDDQQACAFTGQLPASPAGRRLGDLRGAGGADVGQPLVRSGPGQRDVAQRRTSLPESAWESVPAVPGAGSPVFRRVRTSSVVGIASAQARRAATWAPAALAKRTVRSSGQPRTSPRQSAPPKASPAPSPLTTSTRTGSATTCSSLVRASTPSGPSFTTATSIPASSSAWAAASGSRVPTAISTSSRLPTATL